MDALNLIEKYYPQDDALRRLLLLHSRQVRDKALAVCTHHPELHADATLVADGAMLHDIGIRLCNAPGILCHGTADYLLHGILGARLMRNEGLEAIARICERHTGTGLRRADFLSRGLEAPPYDLLPETIEEQIVCYADKFFSKSNPTRHRTVEQVAQSLQKYGAPGVETFRRWAAAFE